jgi:hypothetical protein
MVGAYALVAEGEAASRCGAGTHASSSRWKPHVGLLDELGMCNIGNDASMEAVLRYM